MRRRGNNEGSIFKRKDGRWSGQVTVGGHRLTFYGRTKADVAVKLKETLKQVDSGLTVRGAKVTVGEYLQEWLGAVKATVRPTTWESYEQNARVHIIPHIGVIKLKDLRPDQIQSLYNLKEDQGVGAATIRIIHAILHKSLGQAMKWGLIGRNSADAVIRPKEQRREMTVLTPEQAQVLLSHIADTRYEALYYLALTTGLRRGELLGLRWTDLDWLNRKLSIQRQSIRVKEGLLLMPLKTKASQRSITIDQTAVEILRKHLELQQLERQAVVSRWHETGLIFTSTIGTPMDPQNISHYHSKLLEKIGLPKIRFHDLRHTAATLMLIQGVHPKIVQERLGHTTIQMTLDTYSHVLPSMQEEVAAKMEDILKVYSFQVSKKVEE